MALFRRKASSASASSVADGASAAAGCVTPRATPRATPRGVPRDAPRETPPGSVRSTRTANAVQVRIEKMFAEMSATGEYLDQQKNKQKRCS